MTQNLDSFDLRETKKNINNYFSSLDVLAWEQARLNAQKEVTAKYEALIKDRKHPYISIGKDEFNIVAKENKDAELKKHLSGFNWARSILSKQEQLYIIEYFVNGKYEDEIVDLLGFNSIDSWAFRKLKRNAIL